MRIAKLCGDQGHISRCGFEKVNTLKFRLWFSGERSAQKAGHASMSSAPLADVHALEDVDPLLYHGRLRKRGTDDSNLSA